MEVGTRVTNALLRAVAAWCVLTVAMPAAAQLRIVTYNTAGSPRSGMDFVLEALGQEYYGGVVETIDVLLLQEQSRSAGLPDTQAFVDLLNSIYADQGLTYARSTLAGAGDATQTMIYKTNTIELLEQAAIGTVSSSSAARQTMRYKVKPVGYDDSAAFYLYNSHYKASQGSDSPGATPNATRRLSEATAIRSNSDALGEGTHAIYAGDHNFYDFDADEPAFGVLTASGNGQAFDPVNRVGTWHNNMSFKDVHTQSPTTTSRYGGQVTGGLDDRFDFQLVTNEFLDGEGLSYIPGTYHTFGNNGTTYNTDVDSGLNTYPFTFVPFDAQRTRRDLMTALASVSDHLPVVADYQIPAIMGVQVAAIPSAVALGAIIPISITIENIAPVLFSGFADELDYVLSVGGDLIGGATGIDPAFGGGHDHEILLDTSTPGLKSGVITVTSSSQQAANAMYTLPVNFAVLGPTFWEADFNEDGNVDGVDLASWNPNFGVAASAHKSQGDADADGDVDGDDFLVWQRQFSSLGAQPNATVTVPEPGGLAISAAAAAALGWRRLRSRRTIQIAAKRVKTRWSLALRVARRPRRPFSDCTSPARRRTHTRSRATSSPDGRARCEALPRRSETAARCRSIRSRR